MAYPGWAYYKTHDLDGSSDGSLSDFQVRVVVFKGTGTDSGDTVYLGSNVEDDFADVRFTDSSGTPIDYWMEEYVSGDKAIFWVEVPSIAASPSTTTIRIYYGNASAASESDCAATFVFGDDFEGHHHGFTFADWAEFRHAIDIAKLGTDLYTTLQDGVNACNLYKSTDGGYNWSSVSAIHSSGSGRSHNYLDTDGVDTIVVTYCDTAFQNVYSKTSTDSGATWGSEKSVGSVSSALKDPKVLYVSGTTWLCFFGGNDGAGNFKVRCQRSTDDGATWSTYSTVFTIATTGLEDLEDIDAIVAPNGDILVAWERETAEASESMLEMAISSDGGATWGTNFTLVNTSGTYDDEGGNFCIAPNGTDIHFVYGSNKAGGSSYYKQQSYMLTSSDNGASWSDAGLISESYGGVENVVEYNSDGNLVLLTLKEYVAGGTTSTMFMTCRVLDGAELSDKGWTQDSGFAYGSSVSGETDNSMVVASWMPAAATERGFFKNSATIPDDFIMETRLRSPLADVDMRVVGRYTDVNNHYLLSLLNSGGSTNLTWFKRVAGTYTSLNAATVTFNADTWYRLRWQISGANPTTCKTWTGTDAFSALTARNNTTEGTSTQTSGKVGMSAANASPRHVNLYSFIAIRKFTANEPAHNSWGSETSNPDVVAFQPWYRMANTLVV